VATRAQQPPSYAFVAQRKRRRWGRTLARVVVVLLCAFLAVILLASVRIFHWDQQPSVYPPPADAVTPRQAEAVAARILARPTVEASDLGVSMAPANSSSFHLYVEGQNFFPAILADLQAAQSSINIEEYGYTPGEVADQFNAVLKAKAAAGVDVRVIVDRVGSHISASNGMFDDLAAAGVQVVTNDPLPPDRDGLIGQQTLDLTGDEFLHFDHRKIFIVDGRVGWIGGAGIEDYFYDGSFQDVFVRIEGEVVPQLQTVYLTRYRFAGGPVPTDSGALDRYYPPWPEPASIPTTLVHNVPGASYRAVTDAIHDLIEGARQRIDIVDPYVADGATLERLIAASRRGVKVRMIVPANSNSKATQTALQYWYPLLEAAGVEVWLHPILPHAKVLVADQRTLVGSTNLDAWALYRNWEISLVFDNAQIASVFEDQLIEPDIAQSSPAVPSESVAMRGLEWLFALMSPLL
jgi:cardiolipin synthase